MTKTLRAEKLTEGDYADMQRQIELMFYNLIFRPLVDLLAPRNAQVKAAKRELRNAKYDPIITALLSGKVQYSDGTFSGDFSAAVSRALRSYGARFSKRDKTYAVVPQALPVEVLAAAKEYSDTAEELHVKLQERLDQIQKDLEKSVILYPLKADSLVRKSSNKFDQDYGDALGTEDLSEGAKATLAGDYERSVKPYIKTFSDDMIREIRVSVAQNAREGYRFDRLIDRIQNRYGVTQSKAEFLARQETSLFVSKTRQARFAGAGVTEYVWRTAGDSEVRPDHKKLNGRTFRYAEPPVVDEATGRRANAGEDFNCRCVAEPILPGVLANA